MTDDTDDVWMMDDAPDDGRRTRRPGDGRRARGSRIADRARLCSPIGTDGRTGVERGRRTAGREDRTRRRSVTDSQRRDRPAWRVRSRRRAGDGSDGARKCVNARECACAYRARLCTRRYDDERARDDDARREVSRGRAGRAGDQAVGAQTRGGTRGGGGGGGGGGGAEERDSNRWGFAR